MDNWNLSCAEISDGISNSVLMHFITDTCGHSWSRFLRALSGATYKAAALVIPTQSRKSETVHACNSTHVLTASHYEKNSK